MKIAVYYDLPFGGAFLATEEILAGLRGKHRVDIYKVKENPLLGTLLGRLGRDLDSILLQRFNQSSLAKKIDSAKYDVVLVSHDRHFQAPWILRYLKTPTVFLCQEPTRAFFEEFLKIDPNLPMANRLYETINRSTRKKIEVGNAQFASKIISNSVYSSESIFKAYGKISTPVYLGINPKNFYPEKTRKQNQVIVVGNNEPQKALVFAIESVSKIKKTFRPKLVIVSPRAGDYSPLLRLAKRKGVNINLLQGISTKELRNVYNRSKVSLAVAHLEPFGLSVIESFACGTPVVAVNEGGYKETVISGKSGILVERDPDKIAEVLQSLLLNKGLRNKMGKVGIKDVKKRFSWTNTNKNMEKIFYEIT